MKLKLLLFSLLLLPLAFRGQQPMPTILPMEQRAELQNQWLADRIQTLLPQLMRREQIDMWVLIAREYNEDPVLKTLLPATWLSARRRTMLVIYDPGPDKALECLAVARYDVGTVFQKAWDKEQQPDQWARLMEIIAERNPQKIALNRSETFALADGLTETEYRLFSEQLPGQFQDRVVSGERLAVGWLETRSASELIVYPQICRIAHLIIAEGLSEAVIQPGVTTTDEVVWWYRERIRALGFTAWFHPTVDIQRADPASEDHLRSFANRPDTKVILPGDLLHVDFGITYLGLNTDTQWHAYVLKPEETAAPAYLVEALAAGNRLQEILTSQFQTGRTGNEILAGALQQARQEGLRPSIYTHPIGYHGHAAGPTIGLWDQQGGVPGQGDYPLFENTCYAIELNTTVHLEAWQKDIRIMLEEDACFDGWQVTYIDGRQTELLLIPRR